MNTCAELDSIVEIINKHNLPKEQILFMSKEEKRETYQFIKTFGVDGIGLTHFPNTNLFCHKFQWGMVMFYLVNIDSKN